MHCSKEMQKEEREQLMIDCVCLRRIFWGSLNYCVSELLVRERWNFSKDEKERERCGRGVK